VSSNKPLHLVLVPTADSPRVAGSVTYHAYEQWVWKGGGAPGPRPTTPGRAAGARFGGWVLAAEPKTTFSDVSAFLIEADKAWRTWTAAHTPAPGTNILWNQAMPGGIMIAGYVNVSRTGSFTHISVYPYRTGGLSHW